MRLIWSRQSDADKEAIWQFLADRSIDHAERAERRIEERAESLIWLPRQGRSVTGAIRRLSIPDVQVVVDYCIEDDAIRILRVRNTAQDYR